MSEKPRCPYHEQSTLKNLQELSVPYFRESIRKVQAGEVEKHPTRKAEAYALLSHFIKELWPRLKKASSSPMQEEDLGQIEPHQILKKIYARMMGTAIVEVEDWLQEIKAKNDPAFLHYQALVGPGAHTIKRADKSILSGLRTAYEWILDLHGILPEVYFREKFRGMSPAEFENASKNLKPFLQAMASIHIDIFGSLEQGLNHYHNLKGFDLRPEHFYFREDEKGLHLEIKPSVFESLPGKPIISSRVGCPALAAQGLENKNTVAEMAEWLKKEWIDRYYVPYALKYYANKTPEFENV